MSEAIKMKNVLFVTLILLLGVVPVAHTADSTPENIRIAVKEFPPLVFKDYKGFCVDFARIICEKNELDPQFVMFDSVPDLLGAVESGVCDIGFAGITITPEREKRVDFSQPFFESGLMIAVTSEALNPIAFIGNALLRVIGFSIVLFFIGLTMVAHLVWWIERDDTDPQGFPTAYGKGIVDAYWWAVVTMSTVGYGDKRPKKIGGRAIAAIWMFIGIIWFAGLTATLSSALTVDRIRHGEINDLPDLYGKKVAVIEDTTSEDFLRYHNVRVVLTKSFDELIASLKSGRADAIVYDAPPLMYAAKLDQSIKVVGEMFAHQNYGIVFPNSGKEDLQELFDVEIMTSRQTGEYEKIYEKWF
jgi:polar amino acid transport system substrate-binding protein